MWFACVRDEIQDVTFTGVEPHSTLSTRRERWKEPEVALEKVKTAAESASKNTTSEPAAMVPDDSGGTSARPLGPLKAIIF